MTALPACLVLVLVKRATGRERKVSRTVRRRRRPCPSPRSTDPYVAWCCGRPGLRFWVEPGSRSCTVYCGYQSMLRMGEVDEEQAGLWALQRAPISPSLGPADPGQGGPKSLLPQRMREETFSKLWRRHPCLIHVEAGIGRATSAACSPLLQRPETRVMCGT